MSFYYNNDKVTLHFQKFPEGQGQGFPTWRCWIEVNGAQLVYNYYPKPSAHEAVLELLNHIKVDNYYHTSTPWHRQGYGNEEEHF